MRVRCQLAILLWDMDERDAALEHYRELLRLNPNDNQGIRYLLATCCLKSGRHAELAKLLAAYPDDAGTEFTYARALLLFRLHGDTAESREALVHACTTNGYAHLMLSAGISLDRPDFDAVTWGGMDEALSVAAEQVEEWKRTDGALQWLSTVGAAPADAARREFEARFGKGA